MKRTFAIVVCAACAFSLRADEAVLEYELPAAEEAAFDLDTLAPHKAVGAVSLPYAAGATLTATAPDGTPSTLVSAASADGAYSWTGAAGGVWTLANSQEGETTFTVRYPAATRGAGTAADPAKIMDEDELVDIGAGAGYVFTPCGGDWFFDTLTLPAGCALAALDGGLYRLDVAEGGCVFATVGADFPLETAQPGPDRMMKSGLKFLPFAYTGDDWAFAPSAASTLAFTSPSGVTTNVPCTGTGVMTPAFKLTSGVWTVALSGDGVTPLTAHITIPDGGFFLIVR